MKPFNLEEYLADPTKRVVTRDGRKVRIICTDAKSRYPVIALAESHDGTTEQFLTLTKNGKYFEGGPNTNDIYFAPEKHEGWVNIFEDTCGNRGVGSRIFNSKEDAEKEAKNFNGYITTIKVEWEE